MRSSYSSLRRSRLSQETMSASWRSAGVALEHRLHFGINAHDAAQQGALVQLLEDGGQEELAHGFADDADLRAGEQVRDQFAIFQDQVVQPSAGSG